MLIYFYFFIDIQSFFKCHLHKDQFDNETVWCIRIQNTNLLRRNFMTDRNKQKGFQFGFEKFHVSC